MPPQPGELIGQQAIGAYLDHTAEVRGAPFQVLPTRANGQPAFACYLRAEPWGMIVLTLSGSKVDEITLFADPALPGRFGLPEYLLEPSGH
jgi:RNA polymerase sigma-70 factor (ECF subfamily)